MLIHINTMSESLLFRSMIAFAFVLAFVADYLLLLSVCVAVRSILLFQE